LIILNLPSWAGGTDLWNYKKSDEKKGWKPNLIDDGILEVVALKSSFHVGEIKGKLSNAVKIGQGSKIEIILKESDYCQIDGEPWLQKVDKEATKIEINHFNKVPMLSRASKKLHATKLKEDVEDIFDIELKNVRILRHQVSQDELTQKYSIVSREGTSPFVSFINPLSGGQIGETLFKALRTYLHELQVWPLGKGNKLQYIQI
jgi:hypothetical protein